MVYGGVSLFYEVAVSTFFKTKDMVLAKSVTFWSLILSDRFDNIYTQKGLNDELKPRIFSLTDSEWYEFASRRSYNWELKSPL